METLHFGISIITAAITVGAALGYFARVAHATPAGRVRPGRRAGDAARDF